MFNLNIKIMDTYKVMYWRYTAKKSTQIWYEINNLKKATKKLNQLGEKGHYCELWKNDRLIDYRN